MENTTPKHPNNLQAVIYARVSTEEQKEGQTIESQVNELRKFAQDHGYIVVKEYLDEGWSGGLLNRPALDALRDDANGGRFQAVLFYDVDRLARDVSLLGIVKRDLEKKSIRLIFRKLPNGNSPTDHLLINMLGAFAEFERALIADRTRRGRRYKVEVRKLIMGNIPPYGFGYLKKDKEKRTEGYYQVCKEEVVVVKKIFELVDCDQFSARQVVRWLTEQKIPPRKGAKRWGKSSVLRILHRTEYIGLAYYYKYEAVEPQKPRTTYKYRHLKTGSRLRPQTEWVPIPVPECKIIKDEQFWRVQDILSKNKVFSKRNTKYEYLMSKLLYCKCGSLFYGCPMHGRSFYRCGNKEKTFPLPKTCKFRSISTRLIDTVVWREIVSLIQNPKIILANSHLNHRGKMIESKKEEIEGLQEVLRKMSIEEERVFEAYKSSAISLERYQEESKRFDEKRVSCQQRLQQLLEGQKQSFSPMDLKNQITQFCALIRKGIVNIEDNFEKKQRLIRNVVAKAILNLETRELALEINIPLSDDNQNQFEIPPTAPQPFSYSNAIQDDIETTTPYAHGHNITIPIKLVVKVDQ